MENEIYKDVPGYEGLYKVSNYGNVKSLSYNRTGKEKILKLDIDGAGYYRISLCKNGQVKKYNIHQLVAIAFLNHKPDRTYDIVVDHINNNPLDNRLENLQLVTNRYNSSKDKTGYTSKYVGVYWYKQYNKWKSHIKINGKQIYLGYFTCEMKANLVYQKALTYIHLYNGDAKEFRESLGL